MNYFSQALEAKKVFQGESTIDVARTVNNLANIHFLLGNLDDAMELYQEALDIKTCCLGDDSDKVANTLNNIAHVLVSAGRDQGDDQTRSLWKESRLCGFIPCKYGGYLHQTWTIGCCYDILCAVRTSTKVESRAM